MRSERKYKEKLFIDGINYFNDKNFYDAHEIWEELWNEYKLKDAIFIQGLIQISVAYFHITNSNLRGSRSLFKKSLPKLKKFPSNHRSLNLFEIINYVEESEKKVNCIDNVNQFDWSLAPKINIES